MNLIASLGQGAPVPRETEDAAPIASAPTSSPEPKRPHRKGVRFAPKKGGSTARIIEVLSDAGQPMTAKELAAATGCNRNATTVALCTGTQKGDFVRHGSSKPYGYSLPRFE